MIVILLQILFSTGQPFSMKKSIFSLHFKNMLWNFCHLKRFLLLNLLRWHWLIRLHRFQVYISMTCISHCVPTTQNQVNFHYHIFDPLYLLVPPTPFPLVTIILLSVSKRFCLFFFFVYLLLLLLYPTYEWNYMVLDFMSDLFHLGQYSQGPTICCKWQYFIFFMVK